MADNFLTLNEDKTEVVFIGTWQHPNNCKDYLGNSITIAGTVVEYSTLGFNLSFYFGNNLKESSNVNKLYSTALKFIIS